MRARVDGEEVILHVEFQARHEPDLPERMLAYHALLRHRHRPLPVLSMVVYLMYEPPVGLLPAGIQQGQVTFAYDLSVPGNVRWIWTPSSAPLPLRPWPP